MAGGQGDGTVLVATTRDSVLGELAEPVTAGNPAPAAKAIQSQLLDRVFQGLMEQAMEASAQRREDGVLDPRTSPHLVELEEAFAPAMPRLQPPLSSTPP